MDEKLQGDFIDISPNAGAAALAVIEGKPPAAATALQHAYYSVGTTRVTAEQEAILLAPVDPQDVQIKSDGTVFVPWVHYARRLTKAFGPMGWTPMRLGRDRTDDGAVLVPVALVVEGRLVRDALGECKQQSKMSYASALEGALSDGITKCCKALEMFSELYDPNWSEWWKEEYAVLVHAMRYPSDKFGWYWRRKDRPRQFFKEEPPQRREPARAADPRRDDEKESRLVTRPKVAPESQPAPVQQETPGPAAPPPVSVESAPSPAPSPQAEERPEPAAQPVAPPAITGIAQFYALDAARVIPTLEALMRRKGYNQGKLRRPLKEWTADHHAQFCERLLALPDVPSGEF